METFRNTCEIMQGVATIAVLVAATVLVSAMAWAFILQVLE